MSRRILAGVRRFASRPRATLAACALVASALAVGGCVPATPDTTMPGMTDAAFLGVTAAPDSVRLEIPAEVSRAALSALAVTVPVDAWLVVRCGSCETRELLGYTRLPAGKHRDVKVETPEADEGAVFATLVADRGQRGVFEYDPKKPHRSADRELYVDGEPVLVYTKLEGAWKGAVPEDGSQH